MRKIIKALLFSSLVAVPWLAQAADVGTLLAQGERRANEGANAQKQIDQLADQADELLLEYRNTLKVVDGLKVYNDLLQKQIDNQEAEMNALNESFEKISIIERQIVPLMIRMIDSLEEFIELDTPFLPKERSDRVADLRDMMERSDVTAAEKFRRVLEAYQIENEYGRTIEAYKGAIELDGKTREVDFLRFGRVSLMYQTADGKLSGAWNKESRQFEALPPDIYKAQIANGLRIARKEVAPDLLVVPVPAAAGVN